MRILWELSLCACWIVIPQFNPISYLDSGGDIKAIKENWCYSFFSKSRILIPDLASQISQISLYRSELSWVFPLGSSLSFLLLLWEYSDDVQKWCDECSDGLKWLSWFLEIWVFYKPLIRDWMRDISVSTEVLLNSAKRGTWHRIRLSIRSFKIDGTGGIKSPATQ